MRLTVYDVIKLIEAIISGASGLVLPRGLSVDESPEVFGIAQVKEWPSSADRPADE